MKYNEIILNDRAREDFGNLDELAESIRTYGLIHPIAVGPDKELIAGGRRHAALGLLLKDADAYASAADTDPHIRTFLETEELELGVLYTSREDASVDLLDEMELEENVRRKAFNWKEEICAIYKIHAKKKRKALLNGDSWGMRETGRLLGVSGASVQYAIKIYQALRDPEHEVHEACSANDALNLLVKQKAMEARRLATAKNISVPKPETKPNAETGVEISLDDIGSDFAVRDFSIDSLSSPRVEDSEDSEIVTVPLSRKCFLGNFLDLDLPRFNHIITDPPYGIDIANMKLSNGGITNLKGIEATHDVDENIAAFPLWLNRFYDLLPANGFLIMFCDMVHWNDLRLMADSIGFKTQRWPFVWCKTHSCMNQAADYNFTKNIEVALVARKGAATLISAQPSSYMQASSLPTKNRLHGHPFVKPLELWQHLANAVAIEGEVILDPFSGVGSMPIAMVEGGFDFVSCEISEDYHTQQLSNLQTLYKNILGNGTLFS
jgi:DNA modification methylase